jgi:hypothetical protein
MITPHDLSVRAWKAGCGDEKAVAEEVDTDRCLCKCQCVSLLITRMLLKTKIRPRRTEFQNIAQLTTP